METPKEKGEKMVKTSREVSHEYHVATDGMTANKKWYSEEEVDKIIENCLNAKLEIEHFKETGIPRCPICHKDFFKVEACIWKPVCDCFKNKDLRLSVG